MSTPNQRKQIPIFTGVCKYFPKALRYIAQVSLAGNKQHLEGQPLFWDKTKSMDQEDALSRHLMDIAEGIEVDDDGILHRGKVAWRALASLELYLEKHPQLNESASEEKGSLLVSQEQVH